MTYQSMTSLAAFPLPRLLPNDVARSAHGVVTRDIALKIMSGEFPEGSLLPNEADLVDHYRISRTALREAIKTLAAKGLLVSKTKIGTRVMPKSQWNMFDPQLLSWRIELGVDSRFLLHVFEVRQAIEPAAAALAAVRRKQSHLDKMRYYLEGMERRCTRGKATPNRISVSIRRS
ncbi:MAG TPA: GntR family transcriptional regulator [Devosia sp.]|nr:GntR family transcriptional regulator [Devosia sp.]